MKESDTKTLIGALQALARDIETDDGVVNACLIEAAGRLQSLSAEAPRWISVEERLPEIGKLVLAFYPFFGRPMVVWYGGKPHSWSYSGTVTHWMPLPPLPGEEEAK